jgi:hypothetical protein
MKTPAAIGGRVVALVAAVLIPASPLGTLLEFAGLPRLYSVLLVGIVVAYLALVETVKRFSEGWLTAHAPA